MIKIDKATAADLIEIMRLQKITFLSEAELLHNFNIQPLRQNLSELEAEFNRGVILKAWDACDPSEEIIGSVRGYLIDGTLYIGKLMVHPLRQKRGLGSRLLQAIENWYQDVKRCELFTSGLSQCNLDLYVNNGYRVFDRRDSGQGFELMYMEKNK